MDPITLATITSGVTVLATECAKGIASDAGKSIWGKIKQVFGWEKDPPAKELPGKVAERISQDEPAAAEIVELLKAGPTAGHASIMMGNVNIQGDKVVYANQIHVNGDFRM